MDSTRPDHMEKGGSYVINADQTVTLKERGVTDPAVNAVRVAVAEHEARLKADADKAASKGSKGKPDSPSTDASN